MTLVAGIDCSTQSTKVLVCDADSGAVVASGSAPHPPGTEVDPGAWWAALERATAGLDAGLLKGVAAIGVGGQQHGMVLIDEQGRPVRDALLWNDVRSAPDIADLTAELGGPGAWASAVGTVPVTSVTVTKLRWTARCEPDVAAKARSVLLPHDYLTARLRAGAARDSIDPSAMTTDRGDASGTGYWSPAAGAYRPDILELAFGRELAVPRVAGPAEIVGATPWGAVLSAGTGDNMAAALALDLQPGDIVVSLGTSGTAFTVTAVAPADASGAVAGFADATGRFLPLVCTMNCGLVIDAVAALLGVNHAELGQLALSAPPGAGGLTLLPYLDGERTPNMPDATGTLHGLTRLNLDRAHVARAAFEGVLLGLRDAVQALVGCGVEGRRILLIGGLARSAAVAVIAAEVFGLPVSVAAPAEYVALGAARQAAWALLGSELPPAWSSTPAVELPPPPPVGSSYDAYDEVRRLLHGV